MRNFAIVFGVLILFIGGLITMVELGLLPRPIIEIKNDTGRFVMQQLGESQRNRYVIDTKTGRVWTFANVGGTQNEQMFPVPYYVNEQTTTLKAPMSRSLEPMQEIPPLEEITPRSIRPGR